MEGSHWTACLHSASGFRGFAITSACISVLPAEQGGGFRDFPHSTAEAGRALLSFFFFFEEINSPPHFPATLYFGDWLGL